MLSLDISPKRAESILAGINSRWLDLPSGRVHYRLSGSGPAIVLLHNSGMWGGVWDSWVDELSKSYTVIVPDLPGCGLTGPSKDGNYAIANLTAFVADFIPAVQKKPVHLVGLSLGGQLAWRLALLHPDLVKSLILINPTGYPEKKQPMIFKFARGKLGWLIRVLGSTKMLRKNLQQLWGNGAPISDAFLERLLVSQCRVGNRAAFLKFLRTDNQTLQDQIPNIDKPTQIQWSDMCGAQRFSEDLPRVELVRLNGLGHIPTVEAPAITLAAAKEFIRSQECQND
ncbi:alpha/beta fold hydrolase [Ahrensia sp. 13_GOM-1096m]|uniref:alpha/beta fold hydrolase n=1 Tax=Ahrensia sp. 13_GOM-1096m TaxID=1380380 RepID=UPI0006863738|nr:alpha/beta hydrolase [Ahrensia sp. 13_GOM-1096m]